MPHQQQAQTDARTQQRRGDTDAELEGLGVRLWRRALAQNAEERQHGQAERSRIQARACASRRCFFVCRRFHGVFR
jgi:hypothetical protein